MSGRGVGCGTGVGVGLRVGVGADVGVAGTNVGTDVAAATVGVTGVAVAEAGEAVLVDSP